MHYILCKETENACSFLLCFHVLLEFTKTSSVVKKNFEQIFSNFIYIFGGAPNIRPQMISFTLN